MDAALPGAALLAAPQVDLIEDIGVERPPLQGAAVEGAAASQALARLPGELHNMPLVRRDRPYLTMPPRAPRRRLEQDCAELLPAGARTRAGTPYTARGIRQATWRALLERARAEARALEESGLRAQAQSRADAIRQGEVHHADDLKARNEAFWAKRREDEELGGALLRASSSAALSPADGASTASAHPPAWVVADSSVEVSSGSEGEAGAPATGPPLDTTAVLHAIANFGLADTDWVAEGSLATRLAQPAGRGHDAVRTLADAFQVQRTVGYARATPHARPLPAPGARSDHALYRKAVYLTSPGKPVVPEEVLDSVACGQCGWRACDVQRSGRALVGATFFGPRGNAVLANRRADDRAEAAAVVAAMAGGA